jgi:hypothetical protein
LSVDGEYNCEFEVIRADDSKITVPTRGYKTLLVEKDLAEPADIE